MKVYRLCKEQYATKLDGKGAEMYGGRWNEVGTPMIYTSESRALAILEVLAGIPRQTLPRGFVVVTILLPQKPKILPLPTLVKDWQTYPPLPATMALGTRWVSERKSLALRVPSALMPEERNILINPHHDLIDTVMIEDVKDYVFDERLFGWKSSPKPFSRMS